MRRNTIERDGETIMENERQKRSPDGRSVIVTSPAGSILGTYHGTVDGKEVWDR